MTMAQEQSDSTSLQEKETSGTSPSLKFRRDIRAFEETLKESFGAVSGEELDKMCPLTHEYADGCYIRTIFMPAGTVITSKIHKVCHPYFVMTGRVRVVTEQGAVEIVAPYRGITPAGTKRAIHVLEDCYWTTVHVTNETNLDKIEEQIIAKDFDELEAIEKEDVPCLGEQ